MFSEGGGDILRKSLLLLTSVALTLGGVVAAGQEKSADAQVAPASFSAQSRAYSATRDAPPRQGEWRGGAV